MIIVNNVVNFIVSFYFVFFDVYFSNPAAKVVCFSEHDAAFFSFINFSFLPLTSKNKKTPTHHEPVPSFFINLKTIV